MAAIGALAAGDGNLDLIQLLLDAGATPNAPFFEVRAKCMRVLPNFTQLMYLSQGDTLVSSYAPSVEVRAACADVPA